jgi:hypothetical protein
MKNYSKKKAQSAMEYLMTYGWAILIVIIVAAALYALGVFNPATFTGRTATGFQTIGAPTDWDLSSGGILTLKLTNNKLPNTLTISNIAVTVSGNITQYIINSTVGSLAPGASSTIVLSGIPPQASGSTYSIKLNVLFNAGGLDHTDTGTVTGTAS